MIDGRLGYASSGELQIAYRASGEHNATDLIVIPGMVSHLEAFAEFETHCSWIQRLGRTFRVIEYDKRGQGLSDRVNGVPPPEQLMDDVSGLIDTLHCDRPVLFGYSEGGAIALLYAATYPERVRGVVVFGAFPRLCNSDDYSLMRRQDDLLKMERWWGTGGSGHQFCPQLMSVPGFRERFARLERMCCTPKAWRQMIDTLCQVDIRPVLSHVRVPVLVTHRRDDKAVPVANGRFLADNLPNARYVELPTGGHIPSIGDFEPLVEEIEKFASSNSRHVATGDRLLSTVLFTDIVGSSEKLAQIGDRAWRQTLDRHDRKVDEVMRVHRGRLVKSTGDGVLCIFDGPARAISAAQSLIQSLGALDLRIRAGLHTGEIEPRQSDVTGLAVHVAARLLTVAQPGEVLVTRTVADLVAGADIRFAERGRHVLKGIPGEWQLLAVAKD